MNDIKIIKQALDTIDRDMTADEMSQLLIDPNWSTYKMFEHIANDYINGNEDVRKGIDQTMMNITGWSLGTIANNLLNRKEAEA